MSRLIVLPLLLALAVAAAACAGEPSPSPEAGGPEMIALLTAGPPGPNHGCMAALASGRLVASPRSGLGIQAAGSGEIMPVMWPHGFGAVRVEGVIVLLDARGNALAREGDLIELGGGFGRDTWATCGDLQVVQRAPR